MSAPQFVDISTFQPENIDWSKYIPWSAEFDGTARLSVRSSYGNGFTDDKYSAHLTNARARAKALGTSLIVLHYHYSYPQFNAAADEANWQRSVVGDLSAYPNDVLMLDYEENVGQATAAWAKAWAEQQLANYGGRRPTIYASRSYVEARLQDASLPGIADLTMADWTFDPTQRPSCPAPWTRYKWLQWTDKDSRVPGIPEAVDADVYLGPNVAGEYANAEWLPSPNFWSGNTRTYVVIHGTASCGPQTGKELATSSEFTDGKTASVHYINDIDGTVYQIVHEHDAAWGNCCVTGNACASGTLPVPGTGDCHDSWLLPESEHNYNFDTISIENVKHSCDNSEPLTDVQYKQLVALAHDICVRNNIPMKKATDASGGIIGHYDLDPVNKAHCPGTFPWDQFIADVQIGEAMGIPNGWSDDGTTLTAKNSIAVVKGFRAEVLDAPVWDADNVPQIAEYHTDSVLYHRPDLGGGQIQPFRDDLLWWTTAKGVVREQELGLELFLRDQKIADLEKQLAAGGTTPPTPPDTSALKADLDLALAAIQQAETDLKLIK